MTCMGIKMDIAKFGYKEYLSAPNGVPLKNDKQVLNLSRSRDCNQLTQLLYY